MEKTIDFGLVIEGEKRTLDLHLINAGALEGHAGRVVDADQRDEPVVDKLALQAAVEGHEAVGAPGAAVVRLGVAGLALRLAEGAAVVLQREVDLSKFCKTLSDSEESRP